MHLSELNSRNAQPGCALTEPFAVVAIVTILTAIRVLTAPREGAAIKLTVEVPVYSFCRRRNINHRP